MVIRPTTDVSPIKLNDGVEVVRGYAVVGEYGVQEGTKHAPLRGPRVEDQCGRCVVAYPYRHAFKAFDWFKHWLEGVSII